MPSDQPDPLRVDRSPNLRHYVASAVAAVGPVGVETGKPYRHNADLDNVRRYDAGRKSVTVASVAVPPPISTGRSPLNSAIRSAISCAVTSGKSDATAG